MSLLKVLFSSSVLSQLTKRVVAVESKISTLTNELRSIKRSISLLQGNSRSLSTSNKRARENSPNNEISSIKKLCPTGSTETDNCSMNFTKDTDNYVTVYTDGACENNGRANAKAGLGVWFGHSHVLNHSEPVEGRATNNVGEIQACTKAINLAKENGIEKLNIHTDSQFVINSMTKWLPGWKRKGWKLADGGPVKNKVDFEKLDAACKSIDVKFTYVPGHKGIVGNEKADELARNGAVRYKSV